MDSFENGKVPIKNNKCDPDLVQISGDDPLGVSLSKFWQILLDE